MHGSQHGKLADAGDLEDAEAAVADAIESEVGEPSSIEQEALLEAAEVHKAQHGKG